jgi:hypothetical protein
VNVMAWKPKQPKWNWREFLTDEERQILRSVDAAKAEWMKLNRSRAGITNRAIQRARASITDRRSK